VNFWGSLLTQSKVDDTSIFYLSQLKNGMCDSDITSGLSQMAETDISKGFSPLGYATGEVNVDVKR